MQFQTNEKVQALDPETKCWLLAQIVEKKENEMKVTWPGYPKIYDCWLQNQFIRKTLQTRTSGTRNTIKKENFPDRHHPKFLQPVDFIINLECDEKSIVATNDPFKCEVYYTLLLCISAYSEYTQLKLLSKSFPNKRLSLHHSKTFSIHVLLHKGTLKTGVL